MGNILEQLKMAMVSNIDHCQSYDPSIDIIQNGTDGS